MNVLFIGIFCHVFACLWHFSVQFSDEEKTWMYRLKMEDADISDRYIASLYWIVQTVVTVGYGDVGAGSQFERLMAIVAMFAGVIFFSLMVGSLTSLLSDLDKKNAAYEDKMKILDNIVQKFDVKDAKLLSKINMIIKGLVYSKDDNYQELMSVLPRKVAISLGDIIFKPTVAGIKFFQDIDPEILLAVAPELHMCRFMINEAIINQGEYPNEVYFIKSGTVGLTLPEHPREVFMTIEEGSYFGEIEVIYNMHRKFSAIAVKPVEVLALERKHFIRIFFKEFKEHGRALKQYAEKRMAKQVKTYDIFKQIIIDQYERRTKLGTTNTMKKHKENLEKDYFAFLEQDTLKEVEPKFSPSFMERNKGVLPTYMGKRDEEDILLDNNDRLPKFIKEIDKRFLKVEEMVNKASRLIAGFKNPTSADRTLSPFV